jgi:hypothetical protein
MDRRTFLKGAVVAASTPAAAFASAAATPIIELVSAHEEASAEHQRLAKIYDQIWDRGDRPPFGEVSRKEIGFRWQSQFAHKTIPVRTHLIEGFENAIASDHMHHDAFGMYQDSLADRIAETNCEMQRVLALFDARHEEYRKWHESSGLAALDAEMNRLDDLLSDLDDRIIRFPCRTLDDVRTKVGHVTAEYGNRLSGEDAMRMLLSLVGEAA